MLAFKTSQVQNSEHHSNKTNFKSEKVQLNYVYLAFKNTDMIH